MCKQIFAVLLWIIPLLSVPASAKTFVVKSFKSSGGSLQTYKANGKIGAVLSAEVMNEKTNGYHSPVYIIGYDASFNMVEVLFHDGSSHYVSVRDIEVNDDAKSEWDSLVAATSKTDPTICFSSAAGAIGGPITTIERNAKGLSSCNL